MKRASQESDHESQHDSNEGERHVNMPKKGKHRMRAHINPLGDMTMAFPLNPKWVDWSVHYPSYFGSTDNNKDKLTCNSKMNV